MGTGIIGNSFWGKRLMDQYSDILKFVGLCDINPGRLENAKKHIGASCPTYTDFEAYSEYETELDEMCGTFTQADTGALYNWQAVGNGSDLCPKGWNFASGKAGIGRNPAGDKKFGFAVRCLKNK